MARRLDEILQTDPNTSVVRLEYEGLEDLAPLLPVLGVLPNLQELDLRGNKLKSLPADLSSLRNVTTLHLQQNLFRCVSPRHHAALPLAAVCVLSRVSNRLHPCVRATGKRRTCWRRWRPCRRS